MYCSECGAKLALVLHEQEGLVPYCNNCGQFRYPQFATAVILVATNREKNKILLAKNKGEENFSLFGGYVKKGETAEKTVTREFREETKLNVVKYRYIASRYQESKNNLLLSFLIIAENGEPSPDRNELEEVKWFTFEEALSMVKKDSDEEYFLKNALIEIKKL